MKSSVTPPPGMQVETPYDGRLFKVQVLSWNDAQGRPMKREVVRHPGAVLIVPLLDDQHVVAIRNRRIAVDETLWEFPAGKLEPHEPPQAAAARELEEETGYRAKRITKLGEFYTSPGFTDELMHAFAADGLEFIAQRLEEGEEIETAVVSIADAMKMIRDGRLRDGKSIAGLMMCMQQRSANGQWAMGNGDSAAVRSLGPSAQESR